MTNLEMIQALFAAYAKKEVAAVDGCDAPVARWVTPAGARP